MRTFSGKRNLIVIETYSRVALGPGNFDIEKIRISCLSCHTTEDGERGKRIWKSNWRREKIVSKVHVISTQINSIEFLETIIRKLNSQNPDASLFICGDFNFCLERTAFKQYLQNKGVEVFPKMYNRLSDSDGCTKRKLPIDYVLVRGPNIQVESHEFNVLSPLPEGSALNSVEEPETTSRCALVEKSLQDVDFSENKCEASIKKEPSLKFGKPR
jgi:hypothetical protein